MAIYEDDGPPDLVVDKWESYNMPYAEKIKEIDELKKQKQPKSSTPTNPKENEKAIIAPPNCFEQDKEGRCRNVALRSDCGTCFYLRLGRTQEGIDHLINLSLGLPNKVQQTKESFLARDNGNNGN